MQKLFEATFSGLRPLTCPSPGPATSRPPARSLPWPLTRQHRRRQRRTSRIIGRRGFIWTQLGLRLRQGRGTLQLFSRKGCSVPAGRSAVLSACSETGCLSTPARGNQFAVATIVIGSLIANKLRADPSNCSIPTSPPLIIREYCFARWHI